MTKTDVLIIGAGPAGLTAAVYTVRAGLQAVVFDRLFYGGQVATTSEVENYPAIEKISGPEFSMNLYQQAISQGAEVLFEEVEQVFLKGENKRVVTAQGVYEGKALIMPTEHSAEN